jgi:hypothetical protein
LAFANRPPNLLSVNVEEEELVRVDRRWVLYTRRRKIWVERRFNNFLKGGANVILVMRW